MLTFGDKIYLSFRESLDSIRSLIHKEYNLDSLITILSNLGTKFEIYLKTAVFPSVGSRTNLVSLIDQLTSHGFDAAEISTLHDFRLEYNKAKHDRTYNPNVLDLLDLMDRVTVVINKLVLLKLGVSDNPLNSRITRVYWVAGWDHYIHGDTEVQIIIPSEFDGWLGPPSIDIINIEFSGWGKAKNDLTSFGIVKEGNKVIPEEQMKAFDEDMDFTGAYAFEGHYKDLISVLAQYELRLELIENRDDDMRAMAQAFILASLDAIKNASITSKDKLKDQIKLLSIQSYAVPNDFKYLDNFTESFSELFIKIPLSEWDKITGPSFCKADKFSSLKKDAKSVHVNFSILIDSDYIVRLQY